MPCAEHVVAEEVAPVIALADQAPVEVGEDGEHRVDLAARAPGRAARSRSACRSVVFPTWQASTTIDGAWSAERE